MEGKGKNNTFAENDRENELNRNKTRLGNRTPMERSTENGLVGTGPQSAGIKQTLTESNSTRSGRTASESLQGGWDKALFKQRLKENAQKNGVWIDDINDIVEVSEKFESGFENEPYLSNDEESVIKLNNLNFLNDNDTQYENTRDFDYFLDRLNSHNEVFPNVKYEIIGFAENSKGEISVVLQQKFIPNAKLASQGQIDKDLQNMGFEKTTLSNGLQGYSNGIYELSDVKPANVLVDTNGDLRFIDLDISSVEYTQRNNQSESSENGLRF